MTKLNDVNTTDILGAIRLGCRCMSNVANPDDNGMPYHGARLRPEASLGRSNGYHEPGRHLNALLNAEAVGVRIDEDVVERDTRAAFHGYSGPLPLPLAREGEEGPGRGSVDPTSTPIQFHPHHIREGLHALNALVKYRRSSQARETAEACIDTVLDFWDPDAGWDYRRMESEHGIIAMKTISIIHSEARCIGPLVKYYRTTGYGPALELATALKERIIRDIYVESGRYDIELFSGHGHSATCVMSSLAQLADLTSDSTLIDRVKAFYDNGLWEIRDEVGWSGESGDPSREDPDRGEMNNSGDILEAALILGRWGYPEYYHDAERMLRSHILPAQLRDISFAEDPPNPEGEDGKRDVAKRLVGAFGFPSPYAHPTADTDRAGFNLDIVGGTVGSLCEAYRDATRRDQAGHWVNLLFDHETDEIRVESPYTHPRLSVTVKRPGPLFVRIPPWADADSLDVKGVEGAPSTTNGYLFFPVPPVNKPVSIKLDFPVQEITMKHRTREIRARLRGDEVVAMDNFGAELTFFDPFD